MIKVIIPCAGYGTRMGMQEHESKEMLVDPMNPGRPLIEYSIKLCWSYGLSPIVISRARKNKLNEYLKEAQIEHIILEKPGDEWQHTVLKSSGLWEHKNILLLPDTRFKPEKAFKDVIKNLDLGNKLVLGLHEVSEADHTKWGMVNDFAIFEKPNTKAGTHAWGLIGFTKDVGIKLFEDLAYRKQYVFDKAKIQPSFVFLDEFKDITRKGVLEEY